jgi:polar amino acid transport system permease protein
MWDRLRESLDLTLFWEYRAILLRGLLQNIYIFLAGAVLATVLAFVIGVARLNKHGTVRLFSTGYAELFRNTPEYVFLVWVYFVLPVIFSRLLATKVSFSPYVASVLALGISYSGFLSETVRAGILAVPRTHIEAAMALGMSRWMIMRRIIVPQAIRRMLPESLNQYVSLFKATSLVSLIAVEDLMYQVSMITVHEMRPLPLYTGAALLYCGIIIAAAQGIQLLSERWRQRGWA